MNNREVHILIQAAIKQFPNKYSNYQPDKFTIIIQSISKPVHQLGKMKQLPDRSISVCDLRVGVLSASRRIPESQGSIAVHRTYRMRTESAWKQKSSIKIIIKKATNLGSFKP